MEQLITNLPMTRIGLAFAGLWLVYWFLNKLFEKDLIKFNKNLRKLSDAELDRLNSHPLFSNINNILTTNIPQTLADYLHVHQENYKTAVCLTGVVVVQVLTIRKIVTEQLIRVSKNTTAEKGIVLGEVQTALVLGNSQMYKQIEELKIPDDIIAKFLFHYGFIYSQIVQQINIDIQHARSYFEEIDKLLTILSTDISMTVGLYHSNINVFNGDISNAIDKETFTSIKDTLTNYLNNFPECAVLTRCL